MFSEIASSPAALINTPVIVKPREKNAASPMKPINVGIAPPPIN